VSSLQWITATGQRASNTKVITLRSDFTAAAYIEPKIIQSMGFTFSKDKGSSLTLKEVAKVRYAASPGTIPQL
jgi:hypothetical protein